MFAISPAFTVITNVEYAKPTPYLLIVLAFLLAWSACRKQEPFELELLGTVHDATSGAVIPNVQIDLYETIVEGGSLTSFPQFATSGVTDANGQYALTFARKNASEYEIRYSSSNHHNGVLTFNPDVLRPNEPSCLSFSIGGLSHVKTRLVNSGASADSDRIDFRFLNATSPCECCDTTQLSFPGADVDTTWVCGEFSERWLKYYAEIITSTGGIILDSIYCEPQDTVDLVISY